MCRRKNYLIYCIILLAISSVVLGQENLDEKGKPLSYSDIIDNETKISEIDSKVRAIELSSAWLEAIDLNLATLQQMGRQNQATINQLSRNGKPNFVEVLQLGDQNITNIQQAGGKNVLGLMQLGKQNAFIGDYDGEGLFNTVYQNGHSNLIEQDLQGSNMEFLIMQQGSGHELIQVEDGSGIGYSVTQTGKNMKVRIEQGHVMMK